MASMTCPTPDQKLVAAATVNRELAALRRAFTLAVKQKRLSRAPVIEMLEEAPPREGFVELSAAPSQPFDFDGGLDGT